MDRNEAIGWLSELMKDAVNGIRTHEFEEALNMAIYDMGIIEELRHERDAALSIANELMKPSAQPEIIHCRDCKYWQSEEHIGNNNVHTLNIASLPCKNWLTVGDWYCGSAERRTDG